MENLTEELKKNNGSPAATRPLDTQAAIAVTPGQPENTNVFRDESDSSEMARCAVPSHSSDTQLALAAPTQRSASDPCGDSAMTSRGLADPLSPGPSPTSAEYVFQCDGKGGFVALSKHTNLSSHVAHIHQAAEVARQYSNRNQDGHAASSPRRSDALLQKSSLARPASMSDTNDVSPQPQHRHRVHSVVNGSQASMRYGTPSLAEAALPPGSSRSPAVDTPASAAMRARGESSTASAAAAASSYGVAFESLLTSPQGRPFGPSLAVAAPPSTIAARDSSPTASAVSLDSVPPSLVAMSPSSPRGSALVFGPSFAVAAHSAASSTTVDSTQPALAASGSLPAVSAAVAASNDGEELNFLPRPLTPYPASSQSLAVGVPLSDTSATSDAVPRAIAARGLSPATVAAASSSGELLNDAQLTCVSATSASIKRADEPSVDRSIPVADALSHDTISTGSAQQPGARHDHEGPFSALGPPPGPEKLAPPTSAGHEDTTSKTEA